MNRTKKQISDAFWALLEEKPFNRITVQNIVECCQVNRNTFYYHFQDIPALAEYSIKEWAAQVILNNCTFGTPINCIAPIAREFMKRKTACIHIYRSSCGEGFIRYLNEITLHVVQLYLDGIAEKVDIPDSDRAVFARFYKCTFAGIVLDWLDAGASYDLLEFCEKVCEAFAGVDEMVFTAKFGAHSADNTRKI